MLKAQTATIAEVLTPPFYETNNRHFTEGDEMTLSRLSGESPETLQFFAELHRSEQFTEEAVLKHFAGIKRRN